MKMALTRRAASGSRRLARRRARPCSCRPNAAMWRARFNDTATRSGPGWRIAASAKLISGSGGVWLSPGAGPRSASSDSATSTTLRAKPPSTVRPCQCSGGGIVEIRPREGASANRPQNAAGTRIEPALSEPRPTGAKPAATAAAVSPLVPPVVVPVSHGLRVTPYVGDCVSCPHVASSGRVVLPGIGAPATRKRRTTSASAPAGVS